MADLLDYQFEVDGYVFGLGRPVFTNEDGFDPSGAEWRVQDQSVAQGSGTVFGRDYLEPASWTWALGVDRTSEATALAEMALLTRAWRVSARLGPGEVVPLRYRLAGRTRRVYGRPRRLAPTLDNRFMSGYAAYLADFKRADDLHYDDVEKSATTTAQVSSAGGIKSPLKAPLRSIRQITSERGGGIEVGGDADTWAVVTIKGPISTAVVECPGRWRVELNKTLLADDVVVIDPRPWARTVLLNGGGGIAGFLGRGTRLADMTLAPGPAVFTFGGVATASGAQATVSWRDASHSL